MPANKPDLFVAAYDTHYPEVDQPTLRAMLRFMEANPVAGFVFGGDQFDNACISHHTRGKPILRDKGAFARDEARFETEVLQPIEARLPKGAERVWVIGNHDHWEQQAIEAAPELQGVLERPARLRLKERGWQVIDCGKIHRHGKLSFIHGETLTGLGNQAPQYHAKKAVEVYCQNVVYGHTHNPQSFTKCLPYDQTQKWGAWCAPILGKINPYYLRNRPTGWVNGFMVVEFWQGGNFNCYPVVVTNGKFAYGGRLY